MEEKILVCEDTLEGVFSAIYVSYELHMEPEKTFLQLEKSFSPRLFATFESIMPNPVMTQKVIRTLKNKFGEEFYYRICLALASTDEEKADAVYHTIAIGLRLSEPASVMERFANDYVRKVFELQRNTDNEIMHLNGFLRFSELENGILYSKIHPQANILPYLADHFADRFPRENFVIYDEGRSLFVVHPIGKKCVFVTDDSFSEPDNLSEEEMKYRELFIHFCKSIAIKERTNPGLQRQMLPLHFRKYMVEF